MKRIGLLLLLLIGTSRLFASTNAYITLTGPCVVIIDPLSAYNEPGYRAFDNQQSDLTSQVNMITDLNNTTRGRYTIKYFIHDSLFHSDTITRVILVGFWDPLLTGAGIYKVQVGSSAGWLQQKLQHLADSFQVSVSVTGSFNMNVTGIYQVYVQAYDSLLKCGTAQYLLALQVCDTIPPVLHLADTFFSFSTPGVLRFDARPNQYTLTDNYDTLGINDIFWTASIPPDSDGLYTLSNGPGLSYFRYYAIDHSGNRSDTVLVTVSFTPKQGLNDLKPDNRFTLYPNPFRDELQLMQPVSDPISYSLFQSTGQLLATGVLTAERTTIPTKHLSPGFYLLRTQSPSGTQTFKLLHE